MTHESSKPLNDTMAAHLLARAREAAARAYAPYSNFPVGAAILTESGEIVTGANVENASYSLTICAERVAAVTAAFAGARSFRAIAVVAPKAKRVTPCGACRQVLFEFVPRGGDTVVILDGPDGPEMTSVRELLPQAFGPSAMNDTGPDTG